MRILVPPVLVGDRICRIVSPVESLLEVEEWVGAWWEPSSITITTVSQSGPAPECVLDERGVPVADRRSDDSTDGERLQELLRVSQSTAPAVARIEEQPTQRHGRRHREYAGSARFRRGRAQQSSDRLDLRQDAGDARWSGPFRRASDPPSELDPDPLAS